MVQIYAINIKEPFEDAQLERFLYLVSKQRQEQFKRFKDKTHALHSLFGELLIRKAILTRLPIMNDEIELKKQEHGKPYVEGMNQIHFNVSHSGEWVVCAVAEQEVGVDLERVKPMNLNLAKRYFTSREYEDILNQPEEHQLQYLFQLWTLKECYVKWCGSGLTMPLDTFSFTIENQHIKIHGTKDAKPSFHTYDFKTEYQLSVCSVEEICNEVTIVSMEEMNRFAKGANYESKCGL